MNYAANTYHFRQDSTFLYFFAVDLPGLAALIDVDQNTETLFGDDLTVADIVWTGPQPTIADQARPAAIAATAPMAELEKRISDAIAQGRRVHFLKPYRAEHTLKITALLGLKPAMVALPIGALHKANRRAAERQVGRGGGRDRTGHRRVAPDVPGGDGRGEAGKYEYEVVAEIMRVAKANGYDTSFRSSAPCTARRCTTTITRT